MKKKTISPANKKRLETLAIYLRELRYSESLTQNEISQSLNLHRNTIIRAENAQNMTLLTFFDLADALDICPSELLDID